MYQNPTSRSWLEEAADWTGPIGFTQGFGDTLSKLANLGEDSEGPRGEANLSRLEMKSGEGKQ